MNYLNPTEGLTCGEYLEGYFKNAPGYVANPDDYSNCGVCPYAFGDDYMKTVGMSYSHRWRNIGLYCAYIVFNVFAMLTLYWTFRVKRFSFDLKSLLPKKKNN
ncbi:unnamed protein product [Ambrosiozyma monospora]|nr:unnamed protein product [Ambrosiozyma monospora]